MSYAKIKTQTSRRLPELFENNRNWVKHVQQEDPGFFSRLAEQQSPEYLWIGCSDSRVHANEITGLLPGELFVHRNIANVVVHTDLNCLSVLQFAVEMLKVKHIMVVGHYGCAGVRTALRRQRIGLADNWLRHVQDVQTKHSRYLGSVLNDDERADRLCELNAIEQVMNVCETTIVLDAWDKGQELSVHAWVYGLKDGLLRDLGLTISGRQDMPEHYDQAVATISRSQQPLI